MTFPANGPGKNELRFLIGIALAVVIFERRYHQQTGPCFDSWDIRGLWEHRDVLDAKQNSDYSAGYSTASLQGRKHNNESKTQSETLKKNIINQNCLLKKCPQAGLL